MNWDAVAVNLPPYAKRVADIPREYKPPPLGKRADLIAKILEAAPGANFSTPSQGRIEAAGWTWSIVIEMNGADDCQSIIFHIKGDSAALDVLVAILNHLKLRAVDMQTDEIWPAPLRRSAITSYTSPPKA
jgi:hypothetical protein